MDESCALNTTDRDGSHLKLDSDKCYICLSAFEKQAVASPENCRHIFCLRCVLRWSQTSNTCPVDRVRFSFIQQMRCPGGDIEKKIKVSTQKKEDDGDDEEEASNTVICEECERSDRGHRLLMCIQCDSGYHMDCLTPSLSTGPEGISIVEEEISDGELMDLLGEVDANASTSSRLRSSTLNLPSSSTEQRRSARVQSRTNSNPRRQATQGALIVYRIPSSGLSQQRRAIT
ncbi:hypothetical protein Q8A73_013602 [Channa argus]|nr:hypothetical protein Q8A73_013602 [Channa argus]